MPLPILPTQPVPDPSGDYARSQAWAMLNARYSEAGNYAVWAYQVLQSALSDLNEISKTDVVGPELQNLLNLLSSVPALDLNSITAYVAPTAPTYEAVPTYSAPTLGTMQTIPTIADPTLPSAPSGTISYTSTDFTDSLVTALKARLEADMAGLNAYEAAVFTRHEQRVTDERVKAYNEITTQFSSRGFDMPPGALLAKQTEMDNESSKRLTDVSADIMATAARESLTGAMQLVDMLGRLNDSKQLRELDAEKASIQMAIETFKAEIEGALGVANIGKVRVDAVVSANEGMIKAYLGEIEGQTAPMKAIADSNHAQAQAYSAAVQGAGAAVEASATPEKLKLQAMGVQGDIAGKAAGLAIESSLKELMERMEAFKGLSQAAMQMIASAMNSVSSSTSFGFSGSASTGYDGDITEKNANRLAVAGLNQSPGGY